MYYRIPRATIVNREAYLLSLCQGKRVLHIGAAQANNASDVGVYGTSIDPGTFLHTRLSSVASHCVGLDYNEPSVEFLRSRYGIHNIVLADIEKPESLAGLDFEADIVILGEVLEHLSNPGLALSNIRAHLMSNTSTLVVTVPNALDAKNILYGLLGREAHDPDHVTAFTPRLLSSICERAGLRVTAIKYYQADLLPSSRNYYRVDRLIPRKLFLFLYCNLMLRITPGLSNGLIALVKKA